MVLCNNEWFDRHTQYIQRETHTQHQHDPHADYLQQHPHTKYLQRVGDLSRLQGGDLTDVVAGVVGLHVADLQVVAVHQSEAVVRGHLYIASCQDSDAALPGQHEVPCNKST